MKSRSNRAQDKIIFKKAVVEQPSKNPPAVKEIVAEPQAVRRRQLFWVYDQSDQVVEFEPESCFEGRQAINNLIMKNVISGLLTDYTAKNYLVCPCCQASHHQVFEECPDCGMIFIADEDLISEDDM